MAIETRFFVRLNSTYDDDDSIDLSEKLGDLFYHKDAKDLEVFIGNSCCNPYVEFWCETLEKAVNLERMIEEKILLVN